MDIEENTQVKLRQPRKRKGEKHETDDMENQYTKNKMFQENIQKKQTEKRKTKFIRQDSPKHMKKISSDIIHDEDLKEDVDKNIKTSKTLSKRQLKKEKALQRETEEKHARKNSIMQRALNYVSKWKHCRNEWKFEKIKQIWLIDNLLDKNSIPDTIFPIVLEYFEGCKGMARETLLKKGMNIIRKAEEEENKERRNEIIESIAYKRGRQLLQVLPIDR